MRRLTTFGLLAAVILGAMGLVSSPRAEAYGTQVIATYSCSYGKVNATFVWTGANPAAYVQAVHLSYTDNGWKPGTYTSSAGLYPWANTMTWGGLEAGTRHFMRFVEWYPDGSWDSSVNFRFDTPWCGADGFTVTYLTLVPTKADTLLPGHTNTTPGTAPGTGISGSSPQFTQPGDYDCAGGPGDGPNYVQGPFTLTGPDTYGLDSDGDGIACEVGEGN